MRDENCIFCKIITGEIPSNTIYELIPWIRTFICRITDIQFSNKTLEEQFKNDLGQMYELYGLNDQNEQKGGEKHAI